jgi:ubiquitin-conjugating enzyme E2 D/E
VCELAGIIDVADLALVSSSDVADLVMAAGLKLIPAKKLANAVESAAKRQKVSAATSVQPQAPPPVPPRRVDECVAIAIDRSGSMGCGFDEMRAWCDDGNQNALDKTLDKRSRMDAVKQVFYAFRDRTSTLGAGAHKLGLIQFDTEVEQMMELSADLEKFEAIVDDMQKRGSTAIYSAIVQAVSMLKPVFDSPEGAVTDLRVLVLTDGQSNSGVSAESALRAANEIGAIVDAIIVGDTPDDNLRRIVKVTGGSCFQIKSLSEGFELMEAEAVVSLRARRGGSDKPPFAVKHVDYSEFGRIQVEKIIRGNNAAREAAAAAPVAILAKNVTGCGALVRNAAALPGSSAVKRIVKELADVAAGNAKAWVCSGEGISIFPDADNIHLMKALIEGPQDTPFEGGTFVLNVILPDGYPLKPPRVVFETPVCHCNVSDTGRVCIDVLENGWSPALSISKVLESIRNTLKNPDTDNALRQWIAELTLANRNSDGADTRYFDMGREATKKDAARGVQEWKVEWGVD